MSQNTATTTAKKVTTPKAATAKKVQKNNTARVEDVQASPETEKVAMKIVRKTSDEKVAELKSSIQNFFGISETQLINFTIAKLSRSTKKTNLVDFHNELIVTLVTKPEVLAKIKNS